MIGLGRPAGTLPQQPTGSADASTGHPPGQWANRQPSPLLATQAVDTAAGQLRTQLVPHPAQSPSTVMPATGSLSGAGRLRKAATDQPSHPNMTSVETVNAGRKTVAAPPSHEDGRESQSSLERVTGRVLDEQAVRGDMPQPHNTAYLEPVSDHLVRPSRPAMAILQPQVTLYYEPPASAPPEAPARPEPAPTIQVTIGRIEVRATPPPAPPPQRQRSASPVMSLDEYLRQRARGGGR